jgi:hypothetical protein
MGEIKKMKKKIMALATLIALSGGCHERQEKEYRKNETNQGFEIGRSYRDLNELLQNDQNARQKREEIIRATKEYAQIMITTDPTDEVRKITYDRVAKAAEDWHAYVVERTTQERSDMSEFLNQNKGARVNYYLGAFANEIIQSKGENSPALYDTGLRQIRDNTSNEFNEKYENYLKSRR